MSIFHLSRRDIYALTLLLSLGVGACCPPQLGRSTSYPAHEVKEHLEELKEKAPGGFVIVYSAPFAIAGQGPRESVEEIADQVVGIPVKWLKQEYFTRDPQHIVTLWMFEGETSYRSNVNRLFGGVPISPYGYYDRCDHIVAADISLGLGTLIHEMVHAFIEANFPDCPPWFNEGFASLYEHTDAKEGRVRGLINWRLPGLRTAIRRKKLPSFHDIFAMPSSEFYDDDRGMHYAASRYLLYYLQEKNLLSAYYHGFLQNHTADPGGEATLLDVLGQSDLYTFQREWERWVLNLKESS